MNEWTGKCENGEHYRIDEVTRASGKKVIWKCSKGHEWIAAIKDNHNFCNADQSSSLSNP